MSISGENQQLGFLFKSDEQFYLADKGNSLDSSRGSMFYSSENIPRNTSAIPENRSQQGNSSLKNEQSPLFVISPNLPNKSLLRQQPFENVSAQDVCNTNHSLSNNSNVALPVEQTNGTNYLNLTSWTSKLTNQGIPMPPPSVDPLTVPLIASQPSCFPAATGPIHLTSRLHKFTPYHNAFSRLSPLQHKPANISQTENSNQQNTMTAFLPKSFDKTLNSVCSKENRFKRTADALHKSGLWEIAMKTGHLIKRNQELQKELEQFKMDALNFLKSVIKNPENRDFIKSVLNSALSAGAAESKKSVMTVVVAAVSQSSVLDSGVHKNNIEGDMCHTISVGEQPISDVSPAEINCSVVSNTELLRGADSSVA